MFSSPRPIDGQCTLCLDDSGGGIPADRQTRHHGSPNPKDFDCTDNPDAIGARLTYQAGDLKRSRMKVGGGGYLSSHDPRVVLGIGKRRKIDWLEIKWPLPGGVERYTNLPIDRYITIVEGTGNRG